MDNNPSYIRQSGILDPALALQSHVSIIGCGTVGSNAAVQLAKAGFGSFSLYDYDMVEPHNIPSQDFNLTHIGKPKVHALADRISDVSKAQVGIHNKKIEGVELLKPGPVVLAVDSMEARKDIFDKSIAKNPMVPMCIDFRMGGTSMQAFSVSMRNEEEIEKYKSHHFDDADAAPLVCGTQSFAPVGAVIGGLATVILSKFLNDEEVPLLTTVDLSGMYMVQAG